jgi:hypothetical protein
MTKRISLPIFLTILAAVGSISAGLAGCNSNKISGEAAGTATALIENAQSTAMVMQAQAMATALVQTLSAPAAGVETLANPIQAAEEKTPTSGTGQAGEDEIQIVAVTTAADGAYIMVQFRAPVRAAAGWYQGKVSVIEESSGNVYALIPAVGTIGPLISHPIRNGELGYVMLINQPEPLKAGAIVTVILGDFKQEHLVIQ